MMDDDLTPAPERTAAAEQVAPPVPPAVPPAGAAKKATAKKAAVKKAAVKKAAVKKAAPKKAPPKRTATRVAKKAAPPEAATPAVPEVPPRPEAPVMAPPATPGVAAPPVTAPDGAAVVQPPPVIDLTDPKPDEPTTGPTTGPIPQLRFSPTGPVEAGSEQELADHDDQDGEHDDELHSDGDQSVGAVAAYAQSVADRRAASAPRKPPPPPLVSERGSEQELADDDAEDGEHDDDLHSDGDQSVGAVAAYAQSLADRRAAATSLTPPLPAEVAEPGAPAGAGGSTTSSPTGWPRHPGAASPAPLGTPDSTSVAPVAASAAAPSAASAPASSAAATASEATGDAVSSPATPAEPVSAAASVPASSVSGPAPVVPAAEQGGPGPVAVRQARERFCDLLGPDVLRGETWPYARGLDLGGGEALRRAGIVRDLERAEAGAVLPFPDGSFDLVVADGLLGSAGDADAALQDVLRVLRPGGRLVLSEVSRSGARYGGVLERLVRLVARRVVATRRLRERWAAPGAGGAGAVGARKPGSAFTAGSLAASVTAAGAGDVRTRSDGLLVTALGASAAGIGTAVHPDRLGPGWTGFLDGAGYRLAGLDRWLARFVPERHFCTVLVTAVKH